MFVVLLFRRVTEHFQESFFVLQVFEVRMVSSEKDWSMDDKQVDL